jgi:rRNA maturation RNase YbeY
MITIISPSRYKISKKSLKSEVQAILTKMGVDEKADINIIFVGRRKMRAIANEYKHEDVALPVLAFPYKGGEFEQESLLGEVILCYPQVILLAAEREKKVEDTILNLVEHGVHNLVKNY